MRFFYLFNAITTSVGQAEITLSIRGSLEYDKLNHNSKKFTGIQKIFSNFKNNKMDLKKNTLRKEINSKGGDKKNYGLLTKKVYSSIINGKLYRDDTRRN
jgi:hypothetical protein